MANTLKSQGQYQFHAARSFFPIETKAKLAWTGPGGLAGLSITEIHPALQHELEEWVFEKGRVEEAVIAEGCDPDFHL